MKRVIVISLLIITLMITMSACTTVCPNCGFTGYKQIECPLCGGDACELCVDMGDLIDDDDFCDEFIETLKWNDDYLIYDDMYEAADDCAEYDIDYLVEILEDYGYVLFEDWDEAVEECVMVDVDYTIELLESFGYTITAP